MQRFTKKRERARCRWIGARRRKPLEHHLESLRASHDRPLTRTGSRRARARIRRTDFLFVARRRSRSVAPHLPSGNPDAEREHESDRQLVEDHGPGRRHRAALRLGAPALRCSRQGSSCRSPFRRRRARRCRTFSAISGHRRTSTLRRKGHASLSYEQRRLGTFDLALGLANDQVQVCFRRGEQAATNGATTGRAKTARRG